MCSPQPRWTAIPTVSRRVLPTCQRCQLSSYEAIKLSPTTWQRHLTFPPATCKEGTPGVNRALACPRVLPLHIQVWRRRDTARYLSIRSRMNRIATYGSKGGGGKTTASVVLCIGLHLPLCDLDPQRSATKWLARRPLPHPLAPAGSKRWVADCPPGISGEHIGVLARAGLVVIPVRPSFNDLQVARDGQVR